MFQLLVWRVSCCTLENLRLTHGGLSLHAGDGGQRLKLGMRAGAISVTAFGNSREGSSSHCPRVMASRAPVVRGWRRAEQRTTIWPNLQQQENDSKRLFICPVPGILVRMRQGRPAAHGYAEERGCLRGGLWIRGLGRAI